MTRSILVPGLEHGGNPIPVASRRGPLLATSGVSGVDRATGLLPGALREEVRLAFANLGEVLRAGGADWEDVAHVTVFLAERGTRAHVNEEWVAVYPDEAARPARHVLVQALPGGLEVQLEALAYVEGDGHA